MTKYWVNTNQSVITKAFMKFAHNTFSKHRGGYGYETYPEIDSKGRLSYVYQVSDHYQSSWTGGDDITYEKMCDYTELDRIVRFYVGLVVPKLKKDYVAEIAQLVKAAMKTYTHGYKSEWYNTYGFDCDAIELTQITEIVVAYLKERSMYREKTEYVAKSTKAI